MEAKYCTHCGTELNGASFCPNCGYPASSTGTPSATSYSTSSWYSAEANTPCLSQWKTSVGMSILGLFASGALNSLSELLAEAISSGVSFVYSLAILAFCMWYTIKMYPSLFTDAPQSTSASGISFLNCFVGGIIFGPLWNSNLTKKKLGISHKVYFGFCVAVCVLLLILKFMVVAA